MNYLSVISRHSLSYSRCFSMSSSPQREEVARELESGSNHREWEAGGRTNENILAASCISETVCAITCGLFPTSPPSANKQVNDERPVWAVGSGNEEEPNLPRNIFAKTLKCVQYMAKYSTTLLQCHSNSARTGCAPEGFSFKALIIVNP